MKLALIGDLHLDERSPRFAHCLEVLDWTIKDALANDVDGFIFLGDLCEGRPSPKVFDALARRFHMIDLAGSWWAAVQGNHEDYETGMMLRWLRPLCLAWNEIAVINEEEAQLLLIPYPRRGRPPFDNLEQGDTIVGSMAAAARRIHQAVRDRLAACVIAEESPHRTRIERPLIICGHWTVAGMRTRDAEFEQHQGTEVVVPPELLRGAALVAVGHVHLRQTIGPNIVGVGGLIRHSWAEKDDPKSYTLVTVDKGAVAWEFIDVPARDLLFYEGEWGASGWVKELARG